jgi:hypothetical protein
MGYGVEYSRNLIETGGVGEGFSQGTRKIQVKSIEHTNEMRVDYQNRWYLYSEVASTRFGDIGFNFKALNGMKNHFQNTFSHQVQ